MMKKKDKISWIIKYIKKNNLEYILNTKYKNEKINWIKKYSDEIQSICSIISVLIIGTISLILTIQYNEMVNKQTKIMEYEQKPIINITFERNVNDWIDELTITNNGTAIDNYEVEFFPYFNVICNENKIGHTPIRVYIVNQNCTQDFISSNSQVGEMASFKVYNYKNNIVTTPENEAYEIIKKYTNGLWIFNFTYLIKVTTLDRLEDINEVYFIHDYQGTRKVSSDNGERIVEEYWATASKGILFLQELSGEQLFRYTLKLIREKDLYFVENRLSDEAVIYGEYEPQY